MRKNALDRNNVPVTAYNENIQSNLNDNQTMQMLLYHLLLCQAPTYNIIFKASTV